MTNPVIYQRSKEGKILLDLEGNKLVDEDKTEEYKHRPIYSVEEIDETIKKADALKTEYFRLRAKCIISLFKKFGKRRSEVASIELKNIKIRNGALEIAFELRKKHKAGYAQYRIFLAKEYPDALKTKTDEQLHKDWVEWKKTPAGTITTNRPKSLKSIDLDDKYAVNVLVYLEYLVKHFPTTKYLFPSGREMFGNKSKYVLAKVDRCLSGVQLLRIIKPLNPNGWAHLYRESKGAEVAIEFGRTLQSIFAVKDTLDLEHEESAYRYVRRFASQKMQKE